MSWTRMKTIAPITGPTSVPMPPVMTIMSPCPESTQNMTSGEAKPRKGAKRAPASPANVAAMMKTTSLNGRESRPRLTKRCSFSRIAWSARPKGEIDAGCRGGNPSDGRRHYAGQQRAGEQRHRDGLLEVEQHERAAVRAEAEVRGVSEGHHPRVAHDQVERHREEAEDQEVHEDRELMARQYPGQEGERRHRRQGECARPGRGPSSSPYRPQGRKIRIAAMTAYMMTIAVSGR